MISNESSTIQKPIWPLAEDEPMLAYLREILAIQPRGLCTDIDGTISEFAPTVDAAVLAPGMRKLLREATKRFDLVATISGRAIEDQRRLINVPEVWHVGHHGYEWEELDAATGQRHTILYPEAAPYLIEIANALDEIEAELAPQVAALWMERKGITGGVHWRQAQNPDQDEVIIVPVVKEIAAAHHLRTRGGKLGIELFPPISTHKGEGLHRLIEMHELKGVLFLGDDLSDTDAFLEMKDMRDKGICKGLSVGVLHPNSPSVLRERADILVGGTTGVRKLLSFINEACYI